MGTQGAVQGVSRIIRTAIPLAVSGAGALLLISCVATDGVGPRQASPTRTQSPQVVISPVPSGPPAVWVLAPVGVNLRQDADAGSQRLTTLRQGAQLDLLDSRKVGSKTWLHVKTQSGTFEGWVLDDPELVIKIAVDLHIDSTPGGNYSVLAPRAWAVKSGNPATFTSPPSDPEGGELLIQTASDVDKLPATPTVPAKEQRQEVVEIYGKTSFLTVYKADAGGWQFVTKVKFKNRAYLFLYRATKGDGPTDLYKQLLGSVIITDEPPPG